MRVVHLVTLDYGGAYRAAVRINECIGKKGIESYVVLRTKRMAGDDAEELFQHNYERFISKAKNVGNLLLSRGEIIIEKFGTDVTRYRQVKTADVVILHWVNSFLSPREVSKLVKLGKPIIWVMHDMWVFTGGCHIDRYCGRYKNQCGCCPQLKSRYKKDRTFRALKAKQSLYTMKGICYVGPSTWIVGCAKESALLKNEHIVRIPNPLPLDLFYPTDKQEARKRLQLPIDKKVVTFGALKSTDDPNKGFSYLKDALRYLDSEQYVAVIFGNNHRNQDIEKYIKTYYMGIVSQEEKLRLIYTASDVFVAPSLQDNYPSTVLEAMACKTPVVAFAIGGMKDLIIHKQNGYLVLPRKSDKLAEGIGFCARNSDALGEFAYKYVRENNSYEVVGSRYTELIEGILAE